MTKQAINEILARWRNGQATAQEEQMVEAWYESLVASGEIELSDAQKADWKTLILQRIEASIDQEEVIAIAPVHRVHFLKRIRWVAAAVLILLVGIAYFSWFYEAAAPDKKILASAIAPGKEGAKLKLSDGRTLLIDSLADGLIAEDGDVKVYKQNGQIVYVGKTDELVYNEIVTDKGRQWSAQLPDGSTVWLNAASSLRYPLQFKGKERMVAMTGEASFNVVHNDQQPFRVQVRDQLVEDIGTEFNINAYNNEAAIVTTVIEGIASVQQGQQKVTVAAGKQASETNGALTVTEADTDKAIAWRKGLFNFDGADIRTVGRQLERWYNIEVVYEANLPNYQFGGGTYRNNNLQEVLKVLELSGVKFKLEAGGGTTVAKLIVLP